MISLTMSRISSRADFAVELGELRQVDRLDQRAEDHALHLVVFVGARRSRRRPAARRRRGAVGGDGGRGWRARPGAPAPALARSGLARGLAPVDRFPNISTLCWTQAPRRAGSVRRVDWLTRAAVRPCDAAWRQRLEQAALAALGLAAAGQRRWRSARRPRWSCRWPAPRRSSGRCWRPCRRAAASNGIDAERLDAERLGEFGGVDLRPLGHADLVEHEPRRRHRWGGWRAAGRSGSWRCAARRAPAPPRSRSRRRRSARAWPRPLQTWGTSRTTQGTLARSRSKSWSNASSGRS